MGADDEEMGTTEALLEQQGLVKISGRPRTDTVWAYLYLLSWLAALIAGVFAVLNRNEDFVRQFDLSYLDDPKHCAVNPIPRRSWLTSLAGEKDEVVRLDVLFKTVAPWVAGSLVGSLALGVSFVALMRSYARQLVVTAIGIQVAIPAALGVVACLSVGGLPVGVPLLVTAAVLAGAYWWWWNKVELVIQIMRIAAAGLAANTAIIGVAVLLQAVLFASWVPLALVGLAAYTNGQVAGNPSRVAAGPEPGSCTNDHGQRVLCCAWEVDPWARYLWGGVSVLWIWTAALIFEIKVFTISGAIAQWYFAPHADASTSLPARKGASFTMRSFRWALGSSFGSLCLGSAVLTALQLIRQAIDNLRRGPNDREERPNPLLVLLATVLGWLLDLLQYLTKFATVRLAITGETFFTAATRATDLLRRNFMDAYSVWYLPGTILYIFSMLLSVAWAGAITWVANTFAWHNAGDARTVSIGLLAGITFLSSFLIMGFFVAILLNVIDAAFICFAMDRDQQVVTRPDVHTVMGMLPSVAQGHDANNGHVAHGVPAYPPVPQGRYPPVPPPGHYKDGGAVV